MARFIKAPLQTRKALKKQFGVTRVAVNDALSFRFNSRRAIAIREAALAAGGVMCEPVFYPDCETDFANDRITHRFNNSIELHINLYDNSAAIWRKSKILYFEKDVKVGRWNDLIKMAAEEAKLR